MLGKKEVGYPGVTMDDILGSLIPEEREGHYHVEANVLGNAEYAVSKLLERGVALAQIIFFWTTRNGRREMPAEAFYAGCVHSVPTERWPPGWNVVVHKNIPLKAIPGVKDEEMEELRRSYTVVGVSTDIGPTYTGVTDITEGIKKI